MIAMLLTLKSSLGRGETNGMLSLTTGLELPYSTCVPIDRRIIYTAKGWCFCRKKAWSA